MGMFDKFKSTVTTEYKADTKDMRAGLKKLKGEELKRHKALIEQSATGPLPPLPESSCTPPGGPWTDEKDASPV